jgi:hypothetical protein
MGKEPTWSERIASMREEMKDVPTSGLQDREVAALDLEHTSLEQAREASYGGDDAAWRDHLDQALEARSTVIGLHTLIGERQLEDIDRDQQPDLDIDFD